MISKADLEALVQQEDQLKSPVLSVYLDVDQSKPRNRNREFESTLKTLFRHIEGKLLDSRDQVEEFTKDANRVRRWVSQYKPAGQGLIIFCDQSSDFFWQRELKVPIRDAAHWEDSIFLRPLVEAFDEYERYGVILSDRGRARLFTVHLGEIKEHQGVLSTADVRHTKTVGTDHWRSQMRWQRKTHEHARWHAKYVAESMSHLDRSNAFDRLLLAGPVEARTELHELLPKRLRRKVVASLTLPVDATKQEVLDATQQIELEAERSEELKLVDRLLTAAAKNHRAVTTLPTTLKALQEGRIWQLVYADSYAPQGAECEECSALSSSTGSKCELCGGPIAPVHHLVNRILERVSEAGGMVEIVKGKAATMLADRAGSVGAFLRF